MMLDTYRTFGCDEGQPTFRYSLLDGVKDDLPHEDAFWSSSRSTGSVARLHSTWPDSALTIFQAA